MPTVKKIITQKKSFGVRIDKFLKKEIFLNMEITRGKIIRGIKNGRILVNGKNIKPSYILKGNDEITINILEKPAGLLPNKNVKFKIIYEDENIIIINKPAGLQVHPVKSLCDHGVDSEQTLVNGLLHKFPEIKNVGDVPELRPGIVHRLDRDTSGIMAVARNQKTFLLLKNKFKNHEIKKLYWAIVYGRPLKKRGIIEKPLAKSADYKKQVVAGEKTRTKIRPAITKYEVLKNFQNFSLLKIIPETGRTHQIRIHLSSIGHPVVGDEKYRLKNIQKNTLSPRQLLHAKRLEFNLYGKDHNHTARLPEDFIRFLTKE